MTRGVRPGTTWQDRFFRHVTFDGSSCWVWSGYRSPKGYGSFYAGGPRPGDAPQAHGPPVGRTLAHRFAYMAIRGEATQPCLMHSCDRPECVNPWHLTDATPAENTADMIAKGRGPSTEVLRARALVSAPKGTKQWRAKLTDEKVREIRLLAASGKKPVEIAAQMGVWPITIRRVVRGSHWRHVA